MSAMTRIKTNIPKGFWAEHDQELKVCIDKGMTSRQAAILLGITRGAVTRRACRIKLCWKGPDCIGLWERYQNRQSEHNNQTTEHADWIAHRNYFPPRGYCVFPYGDPGSKEFMFCGEKIEQQGVSYCATHHKLSYYRTTRAA